MAKRIYTTSAFDGGLNTKAQPLQLSRSQTPDALNVYPDDLGAITSRLGYTYLNNSGLTIGGAKVRIIDMANFKQDDGTERLVVFAAAPSPGQSGAWQYNSATSAFDAIDTTTGIFNYAAPRIITAQYKNYLYSTDGRVRYKWDGTSWTKAGVSAPSGAATATSGGTGLVSAGDYLYKYTYVNSASTEGNPNSAMTLTFSLASAGQVSLTGLQNPGSGTSWGINGMRIYRTSANGSAYYLVASVPMTSVYMDNISNASLTATIPAANYPPPSGVVMVNHKDRMFYAGNLSLDTTNRNRVYWSALANPEIVDIDLDFFRFGWDGENINALGASADQLLIIKDKSVYELHMPDPGKSLSWFPRKIPTEFGGEAYNFAIPLKNGFIIFSKNGFSYIESGAGNIESTIQLSSDSFRGKNISDVILDQIVDPTTGVTPTAMYLGTGINFKNAVWIALPTGSNAYNDTVFYFDYVRGRSAQGVGAWYKMSNMQFASFAEHEDELYAASSRLDGYVYKLEQANQFYDNITSAACVATQGPLAINAYYTSPPQYGSQSEYHYWKDLREVRIVASAMSGQSLILYVSTDFGATNDFSFHVNTNPNVDIYGVSGTVSHTNVTRKVQIPDNVRGNAFQWKVTNSSAVGVGFKVFSVELDANIRSRR